MDTFGARDSAGLCAGTGTATGGGGEGPRRQQDKGFLNPRRGYNSIFQFFLLTFAVYSETTAGPGTPSSSEYQLCLFYFASNFPGCLIMKLIVQQSGQCVTPSFDTSPLGPGRYCVAGPLEKIFKHQHGSSLVTFNSTNLIDGVMSPRRITSILCCSRSPGGKHITECTETAILGA